MKKVGPNLDQLARRGRPSEARRPQEGSASERQARLRPRGCLFDPRAGRWGREVGSWLIGYPNFGRFVLGCIESDVLQSNVIKGSFCSILNFQDLQDQHACAPRRPQSLQLFASFLKMSANNFRIFRFRLKFH